MQIAKLCVILLAFTVVLSIKYLSSSDEDTISVFAWILDKALHHEAFLQQTPHLKEYKGKLQRLKKMFGTNLFNNNNGSNNTLNKGNNMKR
jgi:hypothetical protein